ncbi:hypothetical protein FA95DRAFT_1603497 [Auriscalpium vulgare]|uniref:Uncharacterized protein n=1 Tax=Auriscalpium vulgare TaxID=40419 RepID=A0ACB8S272_9AGAM|nr:hypothetical protein FA95DRAFT_1603497 [Auriscalpium vulgare]
MTIIPTHDLPKGDAGRRASYPFGLAPIITTLGPASQSQCKRKPDASKLESNAGMRQGGRRVPTSLADSAWGRSVSLPETVPEINWEPAMLVRAYSEGSLLTPSVPRSPLQEVTQRPRFARTKSPPPWAPKWPCHLLLSRIKRQMKSIGKSTEDHIAVADIQELDRQDWADRNRREEAHSCYAAFASPVDDVVPCASTRVVMHGYAHDLPSALIAPLEQLYLSGIHKGSLFRNPADHERFLNLLDIFNAPHMHGYDPSLRTGSMGDVAALLAAWFVNTPGGVIPQLIYEPLFHYCVKASVDRGGLELDTSKPEMCIPPRLRRLYQKAEADQEAIRIAVARDILRLLPSQSLSILVYAFTVFAQLPLGSDNLNFDEIANRFGKGLFWEFSDAACQTTVWLLERWHQISEGLFDPEPEDECDLATPQSAEPPSEVKMRRATEEVKVARIRWPTLR